MTGPTHASEHGRGRPADAAEASQPALLAAQPAPPGVVVGERVEVILAAAADGDAVAWRKLVDGYSRRVFGLLVRQCGDRELAEEVTQGTFVKLVEKLADFEGYEERGRFEAWLFRVAMNGLRDEMRRRKRQAVAVGGESDRSEPGFGLAGRAAEGCEPGELVSRAEEVGRMRLAVGELGEADREVLHLRHTVGMSFAEIAATLEQPLGTVLARAHRALGKLRKRLEEMEAAGAGSVTDRVEPSAAGRRKAGGR